MLRIKGTKVDIRQFREVPHPFVLPEFMNALEWSLPFVAEQSMLLLLYYYLIILGYYSTYK